MVDLPRIAAPAPKLRGTAKYRAFITGVLKDHGFLRELYCNIRRVDAQMWRAAQPRPKHLRWAQQQGIKTILNLRGRRDNCGSYLTEREVCHNLGLTLVDFPIRSRSALEKPTLKAALDLLPTLQYPVMMHCKSGADRTGFMATLYLFQTRGMPLEQAMDQLSLRYGHLRHAKTGVIDCFYEQYLSARAQTGIGFAEWITQEYDPRALDRHFRQNWAAGILIDKILRRE